MSISEIIAALRTPEPGVDERLNWWRWGSLAFFSLHLLVTALTIPFRWDHLALAGIFIGLAWAGPRLRRMSFYCLPFGLTAIAYDNLRFITHLRGTIHVADLYAADMALFGVTTAAGPMVLTEYFRLHPHVVLDLACGFAYLSYIYEVILGGFYLFFKDRRRMTHLAWGFLAVNLMGMATYLIYPAAPPWYVEQYGLGPAVLDALPSAAGAARFDELLGITYFAGFYSRNINVFGAMPSLHCAYPVLFFCVVAGMGRGWAVTTLAYALLMALSAVYLRHHYVLDVLFGALYAVVAYGGVRGVMALLARREQVRDAAVSRGEA